MYSNFCVENIITTASGMYSTISYMYIYYFSHSLSHYFHSCYTQEVIQNADDARATQVKFVLDRRDLPTLSPHLVDHTVHKELRRFQGPALLAYNNAVFSNSDWEGIQNLQQSGEVKDPFKVGKFGIGFSSVYHITGECPSKTTVTRI